MDRAASLAPGTGTGGQGSLHALCNNLQNAGATTYIFGLQLSTFSLCNIHPSPCKRSITGEKDQTVYCFLDVVTPKKTSESLSPNGLPMTCLNIVFLICSVFVVKKKTHQMMMNDACYLYEDE